MNDGDIADRKDSRHRLPPVFLLASSTFVAIQLFTRAGARRVRSRIAATQMPCADGSRSNRCARNQTAIKPTAANSMLVMKKIGPSCSDAYDGRAMHKI
jgi:hypothetical protein